jgi:hypothetical protein
LNLRPLDPQSARSRVHPSQLVPPLPADLHQSSQRISHRPTMFRTTCDKRVTTSQPASPPTANLSISTCPPPSQSCPKTSPRQSGALPHHRTPTAHRNRSRQPVRHPHVPTPAGPAVSFHSAHSRLSDLPPPTFSPASAAWPAGTLTNHPHASRRRRPIPSHRRRPDTPLPGSPAINRT